MPARVLVTGPPLNGRDEYLGEARKFLDDEKTGYYSVFEYMQKHSKLFSIPNLTRENVLSIPRDKLKGIKDAAIDSIAKVLQGSANEVDFISTPARFKIRKSPTSPTGIIDGLELSDITKLDPSLIVIFIADLLEVKTNLEKDPVWSQRVGSDLKTLAEWRRDSIERIMEYRDNYLETTGNPLDVVIFAKGHDHETLADLVIGVKPRIYLSYHITRTHEKISHQIKTIREKLKDHFVCIDPYTIKDWDIVNAYDDAMKNQSSEVSISTFDMKLQLNEVEEAIDEIRAQVVMRDYHLIESTHATVVCHFVEEASYGVMSEIIHTRKEVGNPIYVLYPFPFRPSPWFEFYVDDPSRIIRGGAMEQLLNQLINKMKQDISGNQWPRYKPKQLQLKVVNVLPSAMKSEDLSKLKSESVKLEDQR